MVGNPTGFQIYVEDIVLSSNQARAHGIVE